MWHIVPKLNKHWGALVACILAFIVYIPSLHVGYFADDFDFLVRDRAGWSIADAFTKNTDGAVQGGSWRPLTILSFHGMSRSENGVGQHIVSVLLYCVVVLGVYALLFSLTGNAGASTLGAAAWAVLPVHVEPVMWIAARADVLAGAAGVWALVAWVRGKPWTAAALFILSLLSKEVWIALPLAILLIPEQPLRTRLRWAGALGALAGVWFAVRYGITHYTIGGYSAYGANTFSLQHFINEVVAYAATNLLWGSAQARVFHVVMRHWRRALALTLIAGTLAYRYMPARARAWMGVYALVLLPALVLHVQFFTTEASIAEQRYWFAPSILLLVVLVLWLEKKIRIILLAALTVWGIIGTSWTLTQVKDAAQVRDALLGGWQSMPHISSVVGLPDRVHGVHVAASPFFERMLMWRGATLPDRVVPLYAECSAARTVTTAGTRVILGAPRDCLISLTNPSPRKSVVFDAAPGETVATWNGTEWNVFTAPGVEKQSGAKNR